MESTDMLSRRLSRNDSLDSTLNFESLRMSLQRPVGRKLVLRLSPIGTDTGSVSAKWRLKRTRKIEKNSVVPEFVCERDLDVKLIVSDVTCDVDSVADREYSCKRNNITVNQLKCGHRYLFKVEVVVPANGCIQHNYTGRNDNLNTSIDVGVPQLPPDGCVLAAGILATITSHNTLEFLRHVATIPIRPLCAVIGTGLGVGTDTGIHAGSTSFSNSPTTVGDCLASTGVSVTNTTTAGATVERQSSPEPINSGGLSNTGGTYKHHPKLIQEKAGHSLLASSTSSPNRNNTSLRHSSTTTGTSFENLTVPYFTGTSQNATPAIATCSSIVNRTVTAREAANGNNTTGSHTGMKTAGETTSVVDMAVVVGAGVGSGTGVVVNSSTDCTSLSPTTSRSACSSGTPSGVQSPSVSQNRSNYNNYLDNNSLLAVVLSTVPEDENSSPYSASPEGKPQIRKRTARKLRSLRSLEKAEKQSNTEDMLGLTVRATPITPDMSVDTTSTTRSTRTSLMDACVGNSDAEDGHDHKKTSTGTTRSATDTMPKEKRRSARERSTRTKSSRGTAPVVSQLDVTTRMIRANELQHRLLAVQGRRDNDVPVPYQHGNNNISNMNNPNYRVRTGGYCGVPPVYDGGMVCNTKLPHATLGYGHTGVPIGVYEQHTGVHQSPVQYPYVPTHSLVKGAGDMHHVVGIDKCTNKHLPKNRLIEVAGGHRDGMWPPMLDQFGRVIDNPTSSSKDNTGVVLPLNSNNITQNNAEIGVGGNISQQQLHVYNSVQRKLYYDPFSMETRGWPSRFQQQSGHIGNVPLPVQENTETVRERKDRERRRDRVLNNSSTGTSTYSLHVTDQPASSTPSSHHRSDRPRVSSGMVSSTGEPAGIGTSSMMSSWSNMGTLYDDSCGSTYINTVTGGMDTSSIVYPNLISGPQSPVQPPVRGIKHTGSSSKYRQQNSILPASKGGRSATTCTSAAATAVRGPVSEHGKILQEHEREQQPIEISSSVDTSSSKHVKTHDLTASSVSCDNPSVWDNACDKERTGGMDSPSSSISSKRQQRLQNLFRQSESGKVLSGAVVEPTAPPSTSGGDHHHNGVGIRGGGVHKFEVEVRIGDDSFKRFTYRTDSHLDRVAYDFLRRLRLKPVLHAGLVKAMRQQVSENKTLILLDVADLF
eukprot:Lankesteria_metandrocarpae@DN5461_c0_g1_i1.p1